MTIKPFPKTQLEQANLEYAQIEERAQRGDQVEAVLVSARPVEALRKAYPITSSILINLLPRYNA